MSEGIQVTTGEAGASVGFDADRQETERREVYLDGTLVLIGCGKDKRDPENPVDLHLAEVPPGEEWGGGTGPMWRAEDLYTSTYFGVKREFADVVTAWARGYDAGPWGVLSAEHGVVENWHPLQPYNTKIDDLGDDPTNPDHRVSNPLGRRRPDGQEIVTEMDQWAASVAAGLCRWVASYRERGAEPWENDANELLVLAGQKYITPLRDRGVFEYGIARMAGDPNEGHTFPLETRYLFEEIPAGGNGEQMGWLSEVIDRLGPVVNEDGSEQAEMGAWTGTTRSCEECGVPAADASLVERAGVVYCEECHPRRCARCDSWTTETGLGTYPLCPDCQTQYGGQKREPVAEDTTEQAGLIDAGASPDGEDENGD